MKKLLLFSILIITLIVSCKKSIKKEPVKKILINLKDEEKTVKWSNFFSKEIKFIPLETTKNALIGKITKVKISGQNIYVLDMFIAGKLFQFDYNGKFTKTIGTMGDAPGQYQKPYDFVVDKNQIEILDNGYYLMVYNTDGEFIKRKKLKKSAFNFEKEANNYFFINGDRNYYLTLTNKELEPYKEKFPFISRTVNAVIPNGIFKQQDTVLVRRNLIDTIYAIVPKNKSNKFKVMPYKYIDYGDKSFNVYDYLKSDNIERILQKKQQDYCKTGMYIENTKHAVIYFSYKGDLWMYIKSKKTGKQKLFKLKNSVNDISFNPLTTHIIGKYKDYFIFQIEPSDLLNASDSELKKSPVYKKLIEVRQKIDEKSNPILMLVKFKDNL